MRVRSALRLSALFALCLFTLSISSETTKSAGVLPIGAGAYPLSFADASVWLAHAANDHEKLVTVMVYFHGTAGWTSENTDFKWEINHSPATIHMKVGSSPIDVKYWSESDEVEIFNKKYLRSTDNVFFVDKIDSSQPVVNALSEHDLTFGPDDIPSITLLRRDAKVWSAVTGLPQESHPLGRKPAASEEIVGWDREGLRLLLTGEADNEKRGCELFRRAADKEYAPAEYRLGYCYESGRGERQDYSVANDLYEKAGNQGHVDAQYKLAHSYRTGRGTKINLPLAIIWYKKAAAMGDTDALYNLGWMYATGQGTTIDQQDAYRWFLEGAKRGEPGSQFEVGKRLIDGNGVSKDLMLAYSWFLILKTSQQEFPPDDWKQVEASMEPLEKQLDTAKMRDAEIRSREWMKIISESKMQSYAKQ